LLGACDARPLRLAGDPAGDMPLAADAGRAPATDAGDAAAAGDVATQDASHDAGSASDLGAKPWSPPTATPFSCAPLPSTFLFAEPGPDVPGVYARCGSFAVGRAMQVAVSADGARVALVTGDGIVRVVDIASRTVVAALAPPRAYARRAAFSPSGDTIMTVAPDQREVTLWRADSGTPVWTVALPGHHYTYGTWPFGSVAFSPDGRSAVVSPGSGYFLLDVATGAVRASGADAAIVIDVAYGWGGRRVVVAQSGLGGNCAIGVNGGSVAILDARTLAGVAAVAWREGYPYAEGLPQFRASPTDDLVLTAGTFSQPGVSAFRLSDGGGAPLPPAPMASLPLAFLDDGQRVLMGDGAQLRIVRLADGAVLAGAAIEPGDAIPDTTWINPLAPIAASSDGRIVALGGSDQRLLRVWNSAAGDVIGDVCTTEADGRPYGVAPSALSGDGDLLALGWDGDARVLRRADGARVADVAGSGSPIDSIWLSPDGKYVASIGASGVPRPSPLLIRIADGAPVADLTNENLGSGRLSLVFSPDGDRVYAHPASSLGGMADFFDLLQGTRTSGVNVPGTLLGFSADCPVYQSSQGIWAACGHELGPPVAAGATSAALSPGGLFLATGDPEAADGGATLWLVAQQTPFATIGRRLEDKPWDARQSAVAVSRNGRLVLLGEDPGNPACYDGPGFEVEVVDTHVTAWPAMPTSPPEVIDRLPPPPLSVDDSAFTVAYGPQLWCAR